MSKKKPLMENPTSDFHDPSWPKGLSRRNRCYRFRKNINGKKINLTFGRMSEEEAVKKADDLETKSDMGIDISAKLRRGSWTVTRFKEDYLPHLHAKGLREGSFKRYRAILDNFSYWLNKSHSGISLAGITYEIANDYLIARKTGPIMPNGQRKFTRAFKTGASIRTMGAERTVLVAFFREAKKRGLVDENAFERTAPIKKPSRSEVAACHRILTDEERKALLEAAQKINLDCGAKGNTKFSEIVLFMLHTAMREGETCFLEFSDIDFKEDLIHIKPKKVVETRKGPIPKKAVPKLANLIRGKNPDDPVFENEGDINRLGVKLFLHKNKELLDLKVKELDLKNRRMEVTREYDWKPKASSGSVPMTDTVKKLLLRLQTENAGKSNFVFSHHDGGHCRLKLLDLLKKAKTLAGIKGRLRLHDLRHTAAVNLRKHGVPLETIMGILRHADIRETLIYAPYDVAEGKKAIHVLDY